MTEPSSSRWARSLGALVARSRGQAPASEGPPAARWWSWEPDPASHPWLTAANLAEVRAFSDEALASAERHLAGRPEVARRYAFVGNLANCLYQRAVPLRKRGDAVTMFLHPHDHYMMSQPGWEELDGEAPDGITDCRALAEHGIELPEVDDVEQPETAPSPLSIGPDGRPIDPEQVAAALRDAPFLRPEDVMRFPAYLAYLPLLRRLQEFDSLLTLQSPYLAYLSGRPYLAAQGGGDLWIECSRDDAHGRLQRLAFGSASALLATNPWTFGHARRLGLRNALYLPFMLDDEVYSPGPATERDGWASRVGGSFFVLSTSRIDERYKGSSIALEAFRLLHARRPEARLVLVGWGASLEAELATLAAHGLEHAVLRVPLAGKRRLVRYLRSADCLLDQFSLGAYGATALEAMGTGLPVVMRLELAQYAGLCGEPPPILQAADAPAAAAALERLIDPDERARASGLHRQWFLRHHGSTSWAAAYEVLLAATASGWRPDYARSPLTRRATRAERAHYRRGLLLAPPFPDP